ncbi:hypothetical protein DH2020_011831 [Rehmannia glutinosa]|uniref:GTD-binding domain-containing protein n=1 Tax=Rehmannia glutinosa TaxID=99300 RepID=A0ABR0XEL0_REHGL
MAANKFATMLHRNTNKITLILIYAFLEWVLILFLLLNSLFSYLIIKFAEFFGLKPPCLWCTRLDHIFDPEKRNKNIPRDLLCEVHAKEISNLGYCTNHRKLAESEDMCEDCLFSRPGFQGFSNNFALFPWINEFGMIQNHKEMVGENGEVSLNCSCCGVSLHNSIFSSYIMLKTSCWDVFECAQKENLITEAGDVYDNNVSDFAAVLCDDEKGLEDKIESEKKFCELDENMDVTEKGKKEISSISVSVENEVFEFEVKMENVEEKDNLIMKDKSVQACVEEDAPLEISPQHLEFFLDFSGHRLVSVESVDSRTEETQRKGDVKVEDDDNAKDQCSTKGCEVQVEENEDLVLKNRSRLDEVDVVVFDLDLNEEPDFAMLESMEMGEDENTLVFHAKDCHLVMEEFEQFNNFPLSHFFPSEGVSDVQEMGAMHLDIHKECEDIALMENNENEADVSIGTEIPDLDITDETQNQESVNSTSSANLYEADGHGPMQVEEHMMNNEPSVQLDQELLFLRKSDYGTEESMDENFTSELEENDGVVTIEHLKSALREERKTLQALYVELEEERNASSEAANQTMAMINRLQEEKAAMQMEAFQYQRMMEEQSEYDQEALQLLNGLMVKREKEKQELEKELEVYKKKLFDYETKEKMRVLKKSNGSSRSGFSSGFCSNDEDDSDGLSIDLNHGHEEIDDKNTPVDAVMSFEECLADFEDERLSILAKLKVLEEKLMTLDDENENNVVENGHFNNGHAINGYVKEMNGKNRQQRRIGDRKAKSLLPLFDATSDENGNGFGSNGVNNSYVSMFETEKNKRLGIAEEVDHLYERLQGLESDREFFKHCVSSLRKGDKGMDLLQEILQHLRDLRNVELRVRNLNDISGI